MAVIQRPAKEGNATTYQGKVAQGFTTILASEVDADLDTIYAAWNGGADSVNLRDGSVTTAKLADAPNGVTTSKINNGAVTEAKLAADAHLWTATATALMPVNPATPVTLATNVGDNVVWGSRTAKGRLAANPASAAVYWYFNRSFLGTLDDGTVPSWLAAFENDLFRIGRAGPGVGTALELFSVDAAATVKAGLASYKWRLGDAAANGDYQYRVNLSASGTVQD